MFPTWPHGPTHVISTLKQHGQTILTATVHPQFPTPTNFYMVRIHGGWWLNSIGEYVKLGT